MSLAHSDVDGVLSNFSEHLLDTVGSSLSPEEITDWDIFKFLTPDQLHHAQAMLKEFDWWTSLPVMEGAQDGVEYLRSSGYRITWVTAPWKSCPTWKQARRVWIDKHFPGDEELIVTSDKHEYPADVFWDDKPTNVLTYRDVHPDRKCFVFDAPYNRHVEGPRISWATIRDYL